MLAQVPLEVQAQPAQPVGSFGLCLRWLQVLTSTLFYTMHMGVTQLLNVPLLLQAAPAPAPTVLRAAGLRHAAQTAARSARPEPRRPVGPRPAPYAQPTPTRRRALPAAWHALLATGPFLAPPIRVSVSPARPLSMPTPPAWWASRRALLVPQLPARPPTFARVNARPSALHFGTPGRPRAQACRPSSA